MNFVSCGLLRCSQPLAGIDPAISVRELEGLKIRFFHQSFQEYLTAKRVLAARVRLPPNVSQDAFWRDVPIYMMGSHGQAQQAEFTRSFLKQSRPDYLTSVRLAAEIGDVGLRRSVQIEIAAYLLRNLELPEPYSYAIEAFADLGTYGRDALRDCLRDGNLLGTVVSRSEVHLVESDGEVREGAWRRLARSIYILGELGDSWLPKILIKCLESITSVHLLYHISEAHLTLSRSPRLSVNEHELVGRIGERLLVHPKGDAITRAYASAILRSCGVSVRSSGRFVMELQKFLIDQTDTATPHFRAEFFRRAHGVEAFAEIASIADAIPVMARIFETENLADYKSRGRDDRPGYRPVQSSVLKSVIRLRQRHKKGSSGQWRPFLETVFSSERIAKNAWACRHLEYLLSHSFTERDDISWIASWKDSRFLRHSEIQAVLSNVVWTSN